MGEWYFILIFVFFGSCMCPVYGKCPETIPSIFEDKCAIIWDSDDCMGNTDILSEDEDYDHYYFPIHKVSYSSFTN